MSSAPAPTQVGPLFVSLSLYCAYGFALCLLAGLTPLAAVDIAVDANNDGYVTPRSAATRWLAEDSTSAAKPYIFWLNDDQDDAQTGDRWPVTAKDSDDETLSSVSDLEDLCCINLQHPSGFRPNDLLEFSWHVSEGAPAIALFANEDSYGRRHYLTKPDSATRQMTDPWKRRIILLAPGKSVQLSARTLLHGRRYSHIIPLLFEGVRAGKGQLQVRHLRQERQLGPIASVHLSLHPIDIFFTHLRGEWPSNAEPWQFDGQTKPAKEQDPTAVSLHSNSPTSPTLPLRSSTPGNHQQAWPCDNHALIWLYNSTNTTANRERSAAATVFKRLWHMGYRGRFTWIGWQNQHGKTSSNDRRYSEYRAYKFGRSVADHVKTLKKEQAQTQVSITAQDLGNMALVEALRLGVDCQAAIFQQAPLPTEMFDTNQSLITPGKRGYKPSAYHAYLPQDTNTTALYSFFNTADRSWLSWSGMQSKAKPARYGNRSYQVGEDNLGHHLKLGWSGKKRAVTDPHEVLSFIAQARTQALGAEPRVKGSIRTSFDVHAPPYAADHDHRFCWQAPPQKTMAYYWLIMDLCAQRISGFAP